MFVERHRWVLFWVALAMSLHAFVVGRVLESTFFIAAFTWGWVAIAALRNSLEAAQAMVITMTFLLVAAIVAAAMTMEPGHLQAYYSLALIPAAVANICFFFYIRFLEQQGRSRYRQPAPAE